jgi:metal-responsive CopG/Arc/MetJ family transcriptional regulator
MDQDRVTRTTLPQVTVGMPLSLLKWVDEQAERAGLSRSKWIVTLIERERFSADDGDASMAVA